MKKARTKKARIEDAGHAADISPSREESLVASSEGAWHPARDAVPAASHAAPRSAARDLDALGAVVAEHPGDAAAQFRLGQALSRARRRDEAVSAFARAAGLAPQRAEFGLEHGRSLIAARRSDEAVAVLAALVAAPDRTAKAFHAYGRALGAAGRAHEAEKAFLTAVEMAPDLADAVVDAARLLARRGVPDEALDLLDRTRTRQPENAKVLQQRGRVLLQLGRTEAAMEAFGASARASAVAVDPDWLAGAGYRDLRQYEQAAVHFRQALGNRPDHIPHLVDLGLTLVKLQQPGEALQLFRRAIELAPENPGAQRGLALALRLEPAAEAEDEAQPLSEAAAPQPAAVEAVVPEPPAGRRKAKGGRGAEAEPRKKKTASRKSKRH